VRLRHLAPTPPQTALFLVNWGKWPGEWLGETSPLPRAGPPAASPGRFLPGFVTTRRTMRRGERREECAYRSARTRSRPRFPGFGRPGMRGVRDLVRKEFPASLAVPEQIPVMLSKLCYGPIMASPPNVFCV